VEAEEHDVCVRSVPACMQDCGKPYYTSNYLAFFYAIKERHPDMQLIANCNMGDDAPTELWDWCASCSQVYGAMQLPAWLFTTRTAGFSHHQNAACLLLCCSARGTYFISHQ
jgi:hypothetical protein